ncbi:MAG: LysM peptidoglycan-binding domain-containing protein, partial [Candidatus Gracilibacteria bacterium]|nr:LysM peptidoglycan-binding domain-containing protein [Candidatus Gracilibacteria bacterium]
MVSKVNLKARIERHSRILKENLGKIHPFRTLYHKFNYNIVLFFVVFLFPIYPLFSSFLYENSAYDFYRGDIDESSIIDSYDDTNDSQDVSIISKDSFLSVNTFLEGDRDLSGYNEIIDYKVQSGDSFSSIAYKFGISNNSILWANNFNSKTLLKPGQVIKIPPVSGIVHQVQSGDTILTLANKYKIPQENILAQNGLTSNDKIQNGQVLIIPGAIKEAPPKP